MPTQVFATQVSGYIAHTPPCQILSVAFPSSHNSEDKFCFCICWTFLSGQLNHKGSDEVVTRGQVEFAVSVEGAQDFPSSILSHRQTLDLHPEEGGMMSEGGNQISQRSEVTDVPARFRTRSSPQASPQPIKHGLDLQLSVFKPRSV